jgi:glucosamine-6-phosphate deaminase
MNDVIIYSNLNHKPMRIIIKKDAPEVGEWVANYIIEKIKHANANQKNPFVLGLPTGSSPMPVYKQLVKKHKEGKISFKNVVTFNMDEYVGLSEEHPESYHYFMYDNLFNHIDIPRENINILNGNAKDLDQECINYEKRISSYGGIDLFLGGIGPDGHIAFNEPGSSLTSRTRLKTLSYDTILANSRFFEGDIKKVPTRALTVGVGTVMDAREVLIIITGFTKARALREVVEGGISHMWTVSMLQMHQKGIIICDDAATMELQVETVKYFNDIEDVARESLP